MKITLVGFKGEFTHEIGSGIGRYCYDLRNELANISKDEIEAIEINPLFGKKIAITKYLAAYKFLLFNRNKTDITHFLSHNPAVSGKLLKIGDRTRVTIATAIEFGYLNNFKTSKIGKQEFIRGTFRPKDYLMWQLLQSILKGTLGADFLIAISSQTKEEAVKLGFDKNKIFVVNLGIDKRFMRPIKPRENKENFVVGYLGGMRKRKNLEFAIKALNVISDPEIRFDIWGKKELEYGDLVSISKNKNINFKGFAPEEKIVNIYDSFNVYVHPILYTGFELEILEAQARGLPVIIYKYGKIPKEVRKYCFEAKSPEHMAQIIEDLKKNGYNEKLRKKATLYARSFTWEKTANETLDVYKYLYNKVL